MTAGTKKGTNVIVAVILSVFRKKLSKEDGND